MLLVGLVVDLRLHLGPTTSSRHLLFVLQPLHFMLFGSS